MESTQKGQKSLRTGNLCLYRQLQQNLTTEFAHEVPIVCWCTNELQDARALPALGRIRNRLRVTKYCQPTLHPTLMLHEGKGLVAIGRMISTCCSDQIVDIANCYDSFEEGLFVRPLYCLTRFRNRNFRNVLRMPFNGSINRDRHRDVKNLCNAWTYLADEELP